MNKDVNKVSIKPKVRRGAAARRQAAALHVQAKQEKSLTHFQIAGLVLAALGFLFPLLVDIPGLDYMSSRMLSIFFVALLLWITEPIPLVATAALVIFAEVFMISAWAVLPVAEEAQKASFFFSAFADPVIILFLGGFMIADGAEKYGLDKALAATLLRPFLGSPRKTLLGLMIITAFLSMWMSNTATTATMFAVLAPVLRALPKGRGRTGIALSIPVAANVGGMGTPVGTPPNAIALSALESKGMHISFATWMSLAVPLMLVILVIAWLFLAWRYLPKDIEFNINLNATFQRSRKAIIYYCIAGLTVLMWTTEAIHHVNSNAVGFFPVVAMLCLGVMTGEDLKKLDWPVLWLVSGGIALGKGVGASGLDVFLIGSIPWSQMTPLLLLATMAFIGFAMSNVISHSASANLLVPLGISLAATLGEGFSAVPIAAILGLGCSLGMCLPISTPPNAIAYGTREIATKEMAVTGIFVGLIGVILLAAFCPPYWHLLGIS